MNAQHAELPLRMANWDDRIAAHLSFAFVCTNTAYRIPSTPGVKTPKCQFLASRSCCVLPSSARSLRSGHSRLRLSASGDPATISAGFQSGRNAAAIECFGDILPGGSNPAECGILAARGKWSQFAWPWTPAVRPRALDPNCPPPIVEAPREQPPMLPPLSGSNPVATPKITDSKPPDPPTKIWEGSFELGLDGTQGNSQTLNFHLGSKLKWKTKENTFTSEIDYHRNSSSSIVTADNGLQEARLEHNFGDSRGPVLFTTPSITTNSTIFTCGYRPTLVWVTSSSRPIRLR